MNSSIFNISNIIRRNGFAVSMLMLLVFGSVGRSYGQCTITYQSISPLCSGENTGVISATVSAQCGCPYSSTGIYWRIVHPTLGVLQTSGLVNVDNHTFNNLPALSSGQVYTIQISNNSTTWTTGLGGTICSQGTIGLPGNPLLVASSSSVNNILCNNAASGSVTISASGGYYGPFGDPCLGYNVTWTGPTLPPSGVNLTCPPEIIGSSYQMTNLLAGNYVVIVDDYNNCDDTIYITISQPPAIVPNITVTNAICANQTGGIQVAVDGNDGTPSNVGFNIAWQLTGGSMNNPSGVEIAAPGFLSYQIPALIPGTYSVTITDANSCVNSTQQIVGITNPSPMIAGNSQICEGSTQQLTITNNQAPSSGNPWNSSNVNVALVNSSGLVTAVAPGIANISYLSSTGCLGTYQITVNPKPSFGLSNPPTICIGATTTITATSNPNSLVYNYVWNNTPNPTTQNGVSSSSITISPAVTTNYIVTSTNATTGCSSTQNII